MITFVTSLRKTLCYIDFSPASANFTETALIRLVDQLLFDLDKNRASGLVFIDYKKASDLIDHRLLLEKLKAYGVGDNELELLCSYLSGRTQYVHINGCHSISVNLFNKLGWLPFYDEAKVNKTVFASP